MVAVATHPLMDAIKVPFRPRIASAKSVMIGLRHALGRMRRRAPNPDGPAFNVGVQTGVLTDERRMELIPKKRLAKAES